MKFVLVVLLLFSTAALADDFEDRVAAAKRASSTPAGKEYDKALGPPADAAIRACVPPGSTVQTKATFTLVGSVARSGVLSSVDVQPRTDLSKCFAERFAQIHFTTPPESDGTAEFPISVEMTVTP